MVHLLTVVCIDNNCLVVLSSEKQLENGEFSNYEMYQPLPSWILAAQMATFLSRLSNPRVLTAAAVGGATLAGYYYYSGMEAGGAPGE